MERECWFQLYHLSLSNSGGQGSWVLQKGKGASHQPGLSLEAGMSWGEAGELGWEQC